MDKIDQIYIYKDKNKPTKILVNNEEINMNGLQNVDIHIECGIISIKLNYEKIYRME